MTWAFVRSMKRHLSPEWEDEDDFRVEVRSRLDPEVAESLISASHRPYRARFNLCLAIESVSASKYHDTYVDIIMGDFYFGRIGRKFLTKLPQFSPLYFFFRSVISSPPTTFHLRSFCSKNKKT